MNLLLRFYDPMSGSVMMDNQDIRSLNVRWLRSQIGYVGQEPVLFAGTIEENIAYGLDLNVEQLNDADGSVLKDRVRQAAKQANAHDFISNFPDGYATHVGSSGHALSGGQKQRIAIARALIKRPAVLLLDEATSALDAASERLVQESIDNLQKAKMQTTIVIAHRLSTIKNADCIAVVSDGVIAELGTHDSLMVIEGGMYADLVRLQLSNQEALPDASLEEPTNKLLDLEGDSFLTVSEETGVALSQTSSFTGKNDKNIKIGTGAVGSAVVVENLSEDIELRDAAWMRSKMWKVLKPHVWWLLLSLLGAAMVGSTFPIWGLLLAKTENMFYMSPDVMRTESIIVLERFVMLGVCALLGYLFQHIGISQVGQRVCAEMRNLLFESMMKREIAFFDDEKHAVGALTDELVDDARLLHASTGESLSVMLQALSTLVVGLVIGFSASWQISLVVIATFPLNIAAASMTMKARQGQQ